MKCPACGRAETGVIDSRPREGDAAIRRRRRCGGCGHRFTTFEILGEDILAAGFDALGRLDERALERGRELAEVFARLPHDDQKMLAGFAKRLAEEGALLGHADA